MQLQPALEVGAPQDLGDELLGPLRAMTVEHRNDHFTLGEEPVAQVGRKRRHASFGVWATVGVAVLRIGAAGAGQESIEAAQGLVAGGGEDASHVVGFHLAHVATCDRPLRVLWAASHRRGGWPPSNHLFKSVIGCTWGGLARRPTSDQGGRAPHTKISGGLDRPRSRQEFSNPLSLRKFIFGA